MGAHRLLPVICADDLRPCREFYTGLLDLTVKFDSEWYVLLASPTDPSLEIALQRRDQAQIPDTWRGASRGCLYLCIEVDNVDEVHERARRMGIEILERPGKGAMENYDRRHVLLADPSGTLLEILTPTDPQEAVNAELTFDQ